MYRFENDYSRGCIQEILDEMVRTNMESTRGYRVDEYCDRAKEKIKLHCKNSNLDIHFFTGGTMANKLVIEVLLRPREGVISPVLGHVNVHESGAIESTGHKVIALSNNDYTLDQEAKLSYKTLEKYMSDFTEKDDWHMTQPGAVYISHPTERGAVYTKKELIELKKVCEKYDLALFVDGARLSYALCSESDITLEDLAKYTDVFYIGGTKCGAMFGEAVCFTSDKYTKGLNSISKGSGAVLAKGRLLGIQFDVLFTDNLYTKKAENAMVHANKIVKAIRDNGIEFKVEPYTNQLFVVLSKEQLDKLDKNSITYAVDCFNEDGRRVVRFCTDWATTSEEVAHLVKAIEELN